MRADSAFDYETKSRRIRHAKKRAALARKARRRAIIAKRSKNGGEE